MNAPVFHCGTARTLDGVRVVVSMTSDHHTPDELSELLADLLLQLEAACIRMRLQRRALERLAATIRTEWKEPAE